MRPPTSSTTSSRRRRVTLALVTALVAIVSPTIPATATADARPGGEPALEVTPDQARAAMSCQAPDQPPTASPILLLHGTSSTVQANWSWNWVRALAERGRAFCTLQLPDMANGDIQHSAEYVVHSIRLMHRRWGRDISMVGHSQGGMIGRWALKYWPDTRQQVDDYVGLASSNHGTATFKRCEVTRSCAAAVCSNEPDPSSSPPSTAARKPGPKSATPR